MPSSYYVDYQLSQCMEYYCIVRYNVKGISQYLGSKVIRYLPNFGNYIIQGKAIVYPYILLNISYAVNSDS